MLNKSSQIDITLALPTYNEEKNITSVLGQSVSDLEKLKTNWEIIVIDNASSDLTKEKVIEFIENERRVRLIFHSTNLLYSGSCATALRESRGRHVAIMDSDGQFTTEDLRKFIEKLNKGANFVIGWRRKRKDPILRLIISGFFNFLGKLWLNYPYHDLNCGIRAFDRKYIEIAKINYSINMVNPELFVRARIAKLKFAEVEVQHFPRQGGITSHDLRKLWRIFVNVIKYFSALRKEYIKSY